MIVTFNIGYKATHTGILSYFPTIWEVENFKEFKDLVRTESSFNLLREWAKEGHVPENSIVLHTTIREDDLTTDDPDDIWEWCFSIPMKNVKGYKK